jgi:N utilization substance protein A
MAQKEITDLLDEIAAQRGIDRRVLISAIETGLLAAAQRKTGFDNLRASFDAETGSFTLFQMKTVKEEPLDPDHEIAPREAAAYSQKPEPGAVIAVPFSLPDLGRLAAMTIRQMMVKTLAEIQADHRYAQMMQNRWQMMTAAVRGKNDDGDIICNIADATAELPREEQAFRESFENGDLIKVVVTNIAQRGREPVYIVSRTHPLLLRYLLRMEVPEIADGAVEIRSMARDTAGRSKVAVASNNPSVDPVGACIGPGGSRIQRIIKELHGENIDVVKWSDDPAKLIAASLTPAKVKSVKCNAATHEADVELEPDQQSVAVGKKGLNIRLASRLTRWSIKVV